MRRILFVDDEAAVLEGLRNALRKNRKRWDMVFVTGGEDALSALRAAPFDVVVSDMRMPGMDGPALLSRVREEFPAVARLVLSGHAEQAVMLRALPLAHQYLSKPCDIGLLTTTLERTCELKAIVSNDALRIVMGAIDKLPSPPAIFWDLNAALAKAETSIADIALIIERDPATSARVLRFVNAACFGLSRQITAIPQAVSYLGIELIRNLVLTAHLVETIKNLPPPRKIPCDILQGHALAVARVAKRIAPRELASTAFTAGLLHDVGHVVIALSLEAELDQILRTVAAGASLVDTEREVLGFTHAEAGAYLLGLWGLPEPIVRAVAHHHSPARAGDTGLGLAGLVHVSEVLAESVAKSGAVAALHGSRGPQIDEAWLASVGGATSFDRWRALAEEELSR